MEIVSFEVAKALKEAGYPQDINVIDGYDIHGEETVIYSSSKKCEYIAPTYLEVWLWLWREKKIDLSIIGQSIDKWAVSIFTGDVIATEVLLNFTDPEEAIKQGVKYLVDNDLIK